ncbi:hypothetical protein D3C72_1868150 [compost metagenome]
MAKACSYARNPRDTDITSSTFSPTDRCQPRATPACRSRSKASRAVMVLSVKAANPLYALNHFWRSSGDSTDSSALPELVACTALNPPGWCEKRMVCLDSATIR